MRRTMLIPVMGVIGLAGLTIAAALDAAAEQEETQRPAQNMQTLIQRVEKLEARVAELEKRRPTAVLTRAQAPTLRELPKGRQRKEFNGLPYYIIPLQANGEKVRR